MEPLDNLADATRFAVGTWAQRQRHISEVHGTADLVALNVPADFPAVTEPGGLPAGWVAYPTSEHQAAARTPMGWAMMWAGVIEDTTGDPFRMLCITATYPTLGALVQGFLYTPVLAPEHPSALNARIGALLSEHLTEDEFTPSDRMLAALGGNVTIPPAAYDPTLHQRVPQPQ